MKTQIKKINGIRYKVQLDSTLMTFSVGNAGRYEEKFHVMEEIPDIFVELFILCAATK